MGNKYTDLSASAAGRETPVFPILLRSMALASSKSRVRASPIESEISERHPWHFLPWKSNRVKHSPGGGAAGWGGSVMMGPTRPRSEHE